eukprot:4650007-Alexandrium_andersonii.AAC.1
MPKSSEERRRAPKSADGRLKCPTAPETASARQPDAAPKRRRALEVPDGARNGLRQAAGGCFGCFSGCFRRLLVLPG